MGSSNDPCKGIHAIVEAQRAEIERLCRRYRVQRLALFGSAACGDFDEAASDLDFAVQFAPMEPSEHADSYFGLLFALEDLFGRKVDLVEYGAVRSAYFRRSLEDTEVALYDAA
jgi:predicted nucleotidyltransferase